MKICRDPCFIDIGVAMAKKMTLDFFLLALDFSVPEVFFRNRSRELVPPLVASIMIL